MQAARGLNHLQKDQGSSKLFLINLRLTIEKSRSKLCEFACGQLAGNSRAIVSVANIYARNLAAHRSQYKSSRYLCLLPVGKNAGKVLSPTVARTVPAGQKRTTLCETQGKNKKLKDAKQFCCTYNKCCIYAHTL